MLIFCENTDIFKYFQCEIGLIKYPDEKKSIKQTYNSFGGKSQITCSVCYRPDSPYKFISYVLCILTWVKFLEQLDLIF